MVDYSKFDNIEESDDEMQDQACAKADAVARAPPPSIACKTCSALCAKPLMCSSCKNATYCSSTCQKDDWQYHKRTCTKHVPMDQVFQQKFPGAMVLGGSNMKLQKPASQAACVPSPERHPAKTSVDPAAAEVAEVVDHAPLSTVDRCCDEQDTRAGNGAALSQRPAQIHAEVDQEAPAENTHDNQQGGILAVPAASTQDAKAPSSTGNDSVFTEICKKWDSLNCENSREACKNCRQPCEKSFKCGKCKEAIYCSAKCQREDWQFHKRLCKTAMPKVFCRCGREFKEAEMFCHTCGGKRPDADNLAKGPPMRPQQSQTEVVDEEEVDDWYRHREWQPEDKLEFCPERIHCQQAGVLSGTPQLVEVAPGDADGQQPCTISECSTSSTAVAMEEQNMLPWWSQRLASLQLSIDEPDLNVKVDPINDVTGSASVLGIQGSMRCLFDLEFTVQFDVERLETSAAGFPMQTTSCGQVRVTHFSQDAPDDISFEMEGHEVASEIAANTLVPKLKDALRECVIAYESAP